MKPTSEILKRIRENSSKHSQEIFTRLYRYLLREDTYFIAYQNLYANRGSGTKGTDNDTADGFSLDYIHKIITELKELKYEPRPVRRTYIEKRNGKMRPLGIPSFKDKLIQEIIRSILEAIYEPLFSSHSHGFRPQRSCHTALKEISYSFRGIKWFIEGDIKGCFDSIEHNILLSILSSKIRDSKFLNLIRKFLKAGYMENWVYHKTYSGTPQGGILSPILANIYLNELDKKVKLMSNDFEVFLGNRRTHVYNKQRYRIMTLKKQYSMLTDPLARKEMLQQIHKAKVELRKLPSKNATDKKLVYVRYADDFIIGISGTRKEAEKIKEELKLFLAQELGLELSEEKTQITHSSENANFLGYNINVRRTNKVKKTINGIRQRTIKNKVELLIPMRKIEEFLYGHHIVEQAQDGKMTPIHKSALTVYSDLEIVDTYNAQTRGICNYYRMASNFAKLNYFIYLMEYSCLKTLASKHRTSISKIIKKYRIGHRWGIPYETTKGKKSLFIAKYPDFYKEKYGEDIDKILIRVRTNTRSTIEARLKARKCELCGVERENYKYEIHHVNKMKNLKGKTKWEQAMIARKRKTLVLCHECHQKIHNPSKV